MKNPFEPLDEYEDELMNYTENIKVPSVDNELELKEYFMQVAKNTTKKDANMNLRMTLRDMKGLKAIAIDKGIPYQTLASSVLHQFVDDNLIKV